VGEFELAIGAPCLITLRSSNRHNGYHHAKRFMNTKGQWLDELGMHPGFMGLRSVEEVLSTLVHEMVHHWQQHEGTPSKSKPHNREWGSKMRSVGMVASDTTLPKEPLSGWSVEGVALRQYRTQPIRT
jgi:predicted SprT family Zn-dependent metalloprotease